MLRVDAEGPRRPGEGGAVSDCVLCRDSTPHVCDYSDVGHEPEDIIRALRARVAAQEKFVADAIAACSEMGLLRARVAELEERLAYWESVWKGEMEWAWEDVKRHEARVAELEGAADKLSRDIFTKVGETNDARARVAELEVALREIRDDARYAERCEDIARAALAAGGTPLGETYWSVGAQTFVTRPAPTPHYCSDSTGGLIECDECLAKARR